MSTGSVPLLSLYAWQRRGLCVGRAVDQFYADAKKRRLRRERDLAAKALCARCPVIEDCLAHALRVPERFGVWGGMTAEERVAAYGTADEQAARAG